MFYRILAFSLLQSRILAFPHWNMPLFNPSNLFGQEHKAADKKGPQLTS